MPRDQNSIFVDWSKEIMTNQRTSESVPDLDYKSATPDWPITKCSVLKAPSKMTLTITYKNNSHVINTPPPHCFDLLLGCSLHDLLLTARRPPELLDFLTHRTSSSVSLLRLLTTRHPDVLIEAKMTCTVTMLMLTV